MTTLLTTRSINQIKKVLQGSKLIEWSLGNAQFRSQGVDYVVVMLVYTTGKQTTFTFETRSRLPVDKPEDVVKIDQALRSIRYPRRKSK